MNREIIKLTEFEIAPILYEYAIEDDKYDEFYDENGDLIGSPIWTQFEIIEVVVDNYDLDKSYEDKSTIVRRISDGKYFKGSWMHSYYIDNEYYTTLTEVFPKEKTIIVYE